MMRGNLKSNCHEYIAVYVDDLYISTKKPEDIVNTLKTKWNSKLTEMQNY